MSFSPVRTILGSLLLLAVAPPSIVSEAQIVFPGDQSTASPHEPQTSPHQPQASPHQPPASNGSPLVESPVPSEGVLPGVPGRTHHAGVGAVPAPPKVSGHGGAAVLFFPREEVLPKVSCTTAAGAPGLCRLLVQCATFFAEMAELSRSPCAITEDQKGVCCPTVDHPTQDTNNIVKKPTPPQVATPNLEPQQINFACEQSQTQIEQRNSFERELVFNNIVAQTGTPVFLHARLFDPNENVVDKAEKATLTLGATLNMVKEFGLSKEEAEFGLSKISVEKTIIADTCPPEPLCPETKYRSVDGSCNNIKHKEWGQAATAYQRIIPPDYQDGANAPRLGVTGSTLPSPRTLSRQMTAQTDDLYAHFTLLIMQWGQFVDHDITHTPISKGENFADISCCSRGNVRPPQDLHPECLPIQIPDNDPFYQQFGLRCMEFTRSMPAIRRECRFGPREQMNQISAYIDSSNVYGSSQTVSTNLREGRGGRLAVTKQDGRDLLPGDNRALGCRATRPLCFSAGDVRVNEQPDLVVLHTIWMRQHNKVVEELARLNPGWNDEVLYQEGRRVVNAQMQHITYNEYLPIVLGQAFMVSFGLVPLPSGHANTYIPNVDASINNAFSAAAFRYGHTLVTSSIQGYSKFGTVERDLKLSQSQFAPFFLYEKGSLDSMLRGLAIQPSQKFDNKFTDELTNRLFAQNGSFGMDLVALNIQRGRDHGLPSYNKWRHTCHLPVAKTFSDLTDVMSPADANQLSQLYEHVDDIDLFIGGLLEHPKAGSLLGHTFLCIVGDQFARLKLGDRFYYENGGQRSSFSEAQLDQIRKTSLARIICDNSDDIESMQPLPFVQATLENRRVSCNDESLIPRMSLDPWRNEPVWV